MIGAGAVPRLRGTCYTLLLAYAAFTLALMALALAAVALAPGRLKAALDPLRRLAVIAVIAAAIAATTWLPFLLRGRPQPGQQHRQRLHYLPADGAQLTFPMLQFSLLGALCMVGTAVAGGARPLVGAGGRPGHRRARRLPVVAAVDADHAGAHHAAVVPAAADVDACCWSPPGAFGFLEARSARSRRSDRAAAVRIAGGRRDRPGRARSRSARTSPTCCGPTSPSPTPTPTATASAATGARRAPRSTTPPIDATILQVTGRPRDRDRGADRRLQLPVLLPVLGVPGADVALRQPAGAVRPARPPDREVVQAQDARPVHPRAGHVCPGRRRRCS